MVRRSRCPGPAPTLERMLEAPPWKRKLCRGRAWPSPARPSGGAEGVRELLPRGPPREGLGEVQYDAPHRPLDPDRDLQQSLAERSHLSRSERGGARRDLQRLKQDVGRDAEEQAQLVGGE